MPEGVEIKKFANILIENSVNNSIIEINILKGRYFKKAFDGYNELKSELPLKIISINTKGKFTYIELLTSSNKTIWLFNTLGLTGGWTIASKNKINIKTVSKMKFFKKNEWIYTYPIIWEYISNNNFSEWFEKALNHLNIEFILDNGLRMYFYDQLSFGTIKIINNKKDLDKKLKELGPDILDKSTTFEIFQKNINKTINLDKPIGNVIVNQKIIAGIGNYLRSDALWMAKISPFRTVKNITINELELIYNCVRALMWGDYNYEEALKLKYISKDFKIPHDYNREFFVYRQTKDIDNEPITKQELYEGTQKRFLYWIPNKQK